jgi:two-component system, OmpR family, response regulator MprA
MGKAHLLIADENKVHVSRLAKRFQDVGYDLTEAYDRAEALRKIVEILPDLILIGYQEPNLTEIDTIEWMRRMRAAGFNTPAILMTAYNSDQIHIRSLQAGFDDYLPNSVSFDIMLARVERRLRNHVLPLEPPKRMSFADVEIDTRSHTVHRGSRLLDLTATEYALLALFLSHPEQLLTRQQILRYAWKSDFDGDPQIVDTYVGRLRRKLQADGGKRLIETIRGEGYMLCDP